MATAVHLSPVVVHLPPVIVHLSPVVVHLPPVVVHVPPVPLHLSPVALHLSPARSHHSPTSAHDSPTPARDSPVRAHQPLARPHLRPPCAHGFLFTTHRRPPVEARQLLHYDTLRRVHHLLETDCPAGESFAVQRRRIDVAKRTIDQLMVDQLLAKLLIGGGGVELRSLANALRRQMILIARQAKDLLKFAPGAERNFKVPAERTPAAKVAAAGERMAKAAKPHRKLFVEVGLSKDFVTRLATDSKALSERAAKSSEGKRLLSVATAEIPRQIRAGRQAISILDALLMEPIRNKEFNAAGWRTSKRVRARKGRPRKKKGGAQSD